MRQCGSKVRYRSEISAGHAAETMQRKRGEEFNAYHCQWCGGWHVGHVLTAERIARRRMETQGR